MNISLLGMNTILHLWW